MSKITKLIQRNVKAAKAPGTPHTMATLIPTLASCLSRMTSGEKRLAERPEHKLEDDYLFWYDVPIGPKQTHPDFVVLHPRRGLSKARRRL